MQSTEMKSSGSRIAIIGAGQVGAAIAFSLILGSIGDEILLVDTRTHMRDGHVHDLSDVAFSRNSSARVRAATIYDARECDIIIITAGSKYSMGETSTQHRDRNVAIVRSIVNEMRPFKSNTILLIVSNPVDLLTTLAQEISGLPPSQVLGSGTFPDSVRLRGILANKAEIASSSIDLYVIGVHGSSQVAAWSTATVGGVPLKEALPRNTFNHEDLADECKHQSQKIIAAKGATPFGIGSVVSSICSSILLDKRDVRPISHYQPKFGCCFSLPAVLGRQGIITTIPIPLSQSEKDDLLESVTELKATIDRLKQND